MSIEIVGVNPGDTKTASEVGFLASDLLQAQGYQTNESVTIGQRAGEYAGLVIFTALREMGIVPETGFDIGIFESTARKITQSSIHPS